MKYFGKDLTGRMANPGLRLIVLLVALAVSVSMLAACSQENVEVKNTVTAYNKMLSEALAKPDPRIMEYLATPVEQERIRTYILYLKKDKKVLVSELKQLEFLKVKVSKAAGESAAVVRTRELWRYFIVDDKTRKRITGEKEISYDNTYHLVRNGSRWVVDRVDAQEKPPGGPPGDGGK